MVIRLKRRILSVLPHQSLPRGSEHTVVRVVNGQRKLKDVTMFYVILDGGGREMAIRPEECEVIEA